MKTLMFITIGLIVYLGLVIMIGRFCGLSSVGDEIFENKNKEKE